MPEKVESRPPRWFALLLYAMLSVLIYLYVLFVIDPRLLYHLLGTTSQYPELSTDWFFAGKVFSLPGGAVEYLSGFMTSLYYYPWVGALVITAVAVSVSFAFRILTSSAGSICRELLSAVPAVVVVMMYNRYDEPLVLCTAAAVSLWFSVLYFKITWLGPVGRAILFFVLLTVLYYLAGASVLLFGVLATIKELRRDERLILVPLYLLFSAALVWLLGAVVFDLLVPEAYTLLLPLGLRMRVLTLTAGQVMYVYIVLFVGVSVLWRPLKKVSSESSSPGRGRNVVYVMTIPAVLAVLGTALYLTQDKTKKQFLEVDYLAQQSRWQEVLEKASAIPSGSYNINCYHNVNKALYYSGELNERMFEFPQYMPSLLLVHVKGQTSSQIYLKRMLLFLSLGHVNCAEHLAHEILENSGDCPLLLETLAKINLLKGQSETAKVFLEKMSQNPISAKKARRMLGLLEKDPLLSGDKEMQYLRSVAIEEKTVDFGFEFDDFFNSLLKRNSRNKMAVEYMMASYLLIGSIDKIAANIHRLGDIGYEKTPRYLEEALVIHMGPDGKNVDFDKRWMPGADAIKRAREFDRIESGFGPANKQAAMNALAKDFGDSYYYYYVFTMQRQEK